MRGHVFLTTLFAMSLAGGVALAEKDHASKDRPQKESVVHERSTSAPRPERLERFRAHGDAERVSHGKVQSSKAHPSEKTRSQLEQHMNGRFASRGNCSNSGEECSARGSSSSSRLMFRSESDSWLSRQREKLREQWLRGLMASYRAASLGIVGK